MIFLKMTEWSGQNFLESCYSEGILYPGQCTRCPDKDPSIYIGETSRTIYVKSSQHQEDYVRASKNDTHDSRMRDPDDPRSSFIWDYTKEAHNGVIDSRENDYKFKVLVNDVVEDETVLNGLDLEDLKSFRVALGIAVKDKPNIHNGLIHGLFVNGKKFL